MDGLRGLIDYMKAIILAGGLGTRISEETTIRPKPMVEIGGMPIVWHIMKNLSFFGIREFILLAGYKSNLIRDFFMNLRYYKSDITIENRLGTIHVKAEEVDDWEVTIVDSGLDLATGGRILTAKRYIDNQEFLMTYGDGLSDVDIYSLLKKHKSIGKLATVTAVKPKGRYGHLSIMDHNVLSFSEKKSELESWINGGFFILQPECLDYISDPNTPWEERPMLRLAEEGQLAAFMHSGFWQSMDTLREKNLLEDLWNSGKAPWKNWQ